MLDLNPISYVICTYQRVVITHTRIPMTPYIYSFHRKTIITLEYLELHTCFRR